MKTHLSDHHEVLVELIRSAALHPCFVEAVEKTRVFSEPEVCCLLLFCCYQSLIPYLKRGFVYFVEVENYEHLNNKKE